jgi:hypothetical protein
MENFTGVVTLVLAMCFIAWFVVSRRGSGHMASEVRLQESFDHVELAIRGTVVLEHGDEDVVTIEAEDNLVPKISSEVLGHTLSLGFNWSLFPFFWPTRPITYHVMCRNLRSITLIGAGKIEGRDLVGGELEVILRGSGEVQLDDMQTDLLRVAVAGSGRITLSGRAREQEVVVHGSGSYLGDRLLSHEAHVSVDGPGQALVDAGERLEVSIRNRGVVKYAGTPALQQSITGGGRLVQFGGG